MTPLPSSPAEELALLERELIWLDTRRVQLLRRRSWLKAALRAQSAGGWQPPQGAPGGWAHAPAAHPAPAVLKRRRFHGVLRRTPGWCG
ncbi:hypothetical protein ABZ630_33585, partial [Streptomyces albidoflavus]|uniref:hypothetical protein n=1 Tax=Streptomyces albidoflavus TaxID=1886 RepID=UPI0033FF7E19